jgi:hypothetical protein
MARQNSASTSSTSSASFVVPSPSDLRQVRSEALAKLRTQDLKDCPEKIYLQRIMRSNNTIKRVDVGSLFASKKTTDEVVPSYATGGIRVDVGSLFSPVSVCDIEVEKLSSTTYSDPEVDRQIAERRALFTSGKSWAEICDEIDDE